MKQQINYTDEIARYNHKRQQYKNMSKEERKSPEGRILRQGIELIGEELKAIDREIEVTFDKFGGGCYVGK